MLMMASMVGLSNGVAYADGVLGGDGGTVLSPNVDDDMVSSTVDSPSPGDGPPGSLGDGSPGEGAGGLPGEGDGLPGESGKPGLLKFPIPQPDVPIAAWFAAYWAELVWTPPLSPASAFALAAVWFLSTSPNCVYTKILQTATTAAMMISSVVP